MTVHLPILVDPIVSSLVEPFRKLAVAPEPYFIADLTFGGGGHLSALLKKFETDPSLQAFLGADRLKFLGVDQDESALERGRARFSREIAEGRLELVHCRMSEVRSKLEVLPVMGILADLGFSSDQIENADRGLSFSKEGPLDMRLDPSRPVTAYDFLAQESEEELARVLFEYGEERMSRRIARAIVSARNEGNLPKTTKGLADLIANSLPPSERHGRIHPATRSFQALRIAVNDEMNELDSLLQHVILSLRSGGRVAILSFHSLEDRKVKRAFQGRVRHEGEPLPHNPYEIEKPKSPFNVLTKKPIEADEAELAVNPRARSAKLRIAERK